jgi:pilus assembly protein CpaD
MTMTKTLFRKAPRVAGTALALSMGLVLAGCGGLPTNRTLESMHQPVVERANYALDVSTGAGGLSYPEQTRLSNWFDAMKLRYGDRVAIDDPLQSGSTRAAVEEIVSRHGLLISDDAPVTPGAVNAGTARIVISRSKATVPGCPDYSAKSDVNINNATSSNFGCATNSNYAAMVANPEHLIRGDGSRGDTLVMSATKAIESYREAKPTGEGGLKASTTGGGGSGGSGGGK